MCPAILFHGTFDFCLFLAGGVQYIFDMDSPWLDLGSLVVSVAMTVGGAVYAARSFGATRLLIIGGDAEAAWSSLAVKDTPIDEVDYSQRSNDFMTSRLSTLDDL